MSTAAFFFFVSRTGLGGFPAFFLAATEIVGPSFRMMIRYFSSASFCVAICPASLLGLSFLICS
jgi:hypothetical protein